MIGCQHHSKQAGCMHEVIVVDIGLTDTDNSKLPGDLQAGGIYC